MATTTTTHGGNFGCLTLKQARIWIDQCGQDGYTIDQNTTKRHAGESFREYIKRASRNAYIVSDDYRPGMSWTGRTPRMALRNAGCMISR